MQPAIDKGYNPDNFSRLLNLSWSSSLHNFVFTTLVGGRPVSASYWPRPMSAWSQRANGPLRDDQVEDLTTFILNWDKGDNWTIDDLNAVNQFPKVPATRRSSPRCRRRLTCFSSPVACCPITSAWIQRPPTS